MGNAALARPTREDGWGVGTPAVNHLGQGYGPHHHRVTWWATIAGVMLNLGRGRRGGKGVRPRLREPTAEVEELADEHWGGTRSWHSSSASRDSVQPAGPNPAPTTVEANPGLDLAEGGVARSFLARCAPQMHVDHSRPALTL